MISLLCGFVIDNIVIIEFYFKSCRVYSNIGTTRTGGRYDPATGSEMFSYTFCWLMSDGSKWRYRRCLKYWRMSWKAWLSWFVRSGAADPGWARRDRARYWWCVAASGRAGLVLWTGTSGAYLVLLSPVVTTVAGEVTADVLMTSL
jgi:hypothetical protein